MDDLQRLPGLFVLAFVEQDTCGRDDHAQGSLELVGDVREKVDLGFCLGNLAGSLSAFHLHPFPGEVQSERLIDEADAQEPVQDECEYGCIPGTEDADGKQRFAGIVVQTGHIQDVMSRRKVREKHPVSRPACLEPMARISVQAELELGGIPEREIREIDIDVVAVVGECQRPSGIGRSLERLFVVDRDPGDVQLVGRFPDPGKRVLAPDHVHPVQGTQIYLSGMPVIVHARVGLVTCDGGNLSRLLVQDEQPFRRARPDGAFHFYQGIRLRGLLAVEVELADESVPGTVRIHPEYPVS